MKFLVVGFGLIGSQRARALARSELVHSIDVYDPKMEPGRAVQTKVVSVSEAHALSTQYDGAIIATPHDIATQSLRRLAPNVRHFLVEKPLGRTSAEGREMIETAESSKSTIHVGFNYRFLQNVSRLKQYLDDPEVGRILSVSATLAHGAEPGYEKSWKIDKNKAGGGVCLDPGVHMLDLIGWLFGDVQFVSGAIASTFWPVEVEDHAALCFRIGPDQVLCDLSLSISSWRSTLRITVETEKAQFFLEGRGKFYGSQRLTVVSRWPWLSPLEPREQSIDFGSEDSSLADETIAFLSFVAGKAEQIKVATAQEALAVMSLLDDCYRQATGSRQAEVSSK